jgi:hypothetical protein
VRSALAELEALAEQAETEGRELSADELEQLRRQLARLILNLPRTLVARQRNREIEQRASHEGAPSED